MQSEEVRSALRDGDAETIRKLAKQMDINSQIENLGYPLIEAVELQRPEAVEALLSAGANVNVRDDHMSDTPLMRAIARGRLDLVRLLLRSGADPNTKNKHNETPLLRATDQRTADYQEMVAQLIRSGADIHYGPGTGTPDGAYENVLMNASRASSPDTVKTLIEAGARINEVYPCGTALIQAVVHNRFDNAKLLLEYGANREIPAPPGCPDPAIGGRNALEIARALKRKKILSLLEKGGLVEKIRKQETVSVRVSWGRIERRLVELRLWPKLNEGASQNQLEALEIAVGRALPDDFKLSYQIHDGQDFSDADEFIPGAEDSECGGYLLLSLQGIIGCREAFASLSQEFASRQAGPDVGVRADWWNPGWVPFATDESQGHLCVDLVPASGGTCGQVLFVPMDRPNRTIVANSFGEWLTHVAEKLEQRAATSFEPGLE